MKIRTIVLTGILLIGAAAAAQSQMMMPAKVGDTSKGKALVNEKGMTLYVFDKDKDAPGKSICNGHVLITGRLCLPPTTTRRPATLTATVSSTVRGTSRRRSSEV